MRPKNHTGNIKYIKTGSHKQCMETIMTHDWIKQEYWY